MNRRGINTFKGLDHSTLTGKVVCGYQGWFTAPGDGSGRGWRHYSVNGQFRPGACGIDLWPDVSELGDGEKYATPFRHKDGRVAHVFSSHNRKTVLRHFEWMRQYGIDGAFVQRFAVEMRDPRDLRHGNAVLAHCREGANRHGRCYAVMYDLSGLSAGGTRHVIEDRKLLVGRMHIGKDLNDAAPAARGTSRQVVPGGAAPPGLVYTPLANPTISFDHRGRVAPPSGAAPAPLPGSSSGNGGRRP